MTGLKEVFKTEISLTPKYNYYLYCFWNERKFILGKEILHKRREKEQIWTDRAYPTPVSGQFLLAKL